MKNIHFLLFTLFSTALWAQTLQPTLELSVLNVKAVDDKNAPQANNEITFVSTKDKKEYKGVTNQEGKFSLQIPPGQKYKVKYKAFATVESDLVLEMPLEKTPYTINYTITTTPPRTFTLDNVFFDTGKSTLRPESTKELNELAEYMQLQKKLVIEIGGHTDNVGSAASNLVLSEERAKAVKAYLEKKGIAPERVSAKGYGDTEPVADNSTAVGRQANRRTEVNIISK